MKDARPFKRKESKPGEVPHNRIPIFDHKGNTRGYVTKAATDATVARFLGRPGATLDTKNGRPAWIGHEPPPPPAPAGPPDMHPMEAARGEAEIGLIQARTKALTEKKPADKAPPKPKPKAK